ncbi:uncharacterized protein LOC135208131 [Macrobrachium nipponense]|uniref:uncharacterized protein LOC135208131 n=1 Tax=Macrobrachium nipponense TaxID=159736 RepID=UPI0030C7D1F1
MPREEKEKDRKERLEREERDRKERSEREERDRKEKSEREERDRKERLEREEREYKLKKNERKSKGEESNFSCCDINAESAGGVDGFKPFCFDGVLVAGDEHSKGVVGDIIVGIVESLPIPGVDVLVGNDAAGNRVVPDPVPLFKNALTEKESMAESTCYYLKAGSANEEI